MKFNTRFVVLAALVGALLVGWTARTAVSQGAPTDRVGYLDIVKVYKEYRKQADTEERFVQETKAFEDQLRSRAGEIEKRAEGLQTLNADSAEYKALLREVRRAQFDLKMDQELFQEDVARRAQEQEKRIYKEITLEAQAYAERANLSAVHLWRPLDEAFESGADLEILIGTRTVVYRHPGLDITDAVVRALNAALPPR